MAVLLARGLTNRQIADELVISEWTADSARAPHPHQAGLPLPRAGRRLGHRAGAARTRSSLALSGPDGLCAAGVTPRAVGRLSLAAPRHFVRNAAGGGGWVAAGLRLRPRTDGV